MGTNLRNLEEIFHYHSYPGNKSTRKLTVRKLTVKCFFLICLIVFLPDAKLPQLHKVKLDFQLSSVQFSLSVVSDSLRPHESQHARPPPVHHQLPEFTQIHVHRVSDAIQPSHPLSSPSPSALIPPSVRLFSNESTLCDPMDCSTLCFPVLHYLPEFAHIHAH